jgi:hypothetical protein
LVDIGSQPTIGLDFLRDVAALARGILDEVNDPVRRVLAWVLLTTVNSICGRFDGEAVTVEDATEMARFVRGPVQEALLHCQSGQATAEDAIRLAADLVAASSLGSPDD